MTNTGKVHVKNVHTTPHLLTVSLLLYLHLSLCSPYSILTHNSLFPPFSTLVSHFPFIISPYTPTTLSSFSNQPEYKICIFPPPWGPMVR